MAQEIRIVVNQLVEAARKEIEEISAGEALKLLDVDNVVIVDVRDARELQCVGKILGSFHAPRVRPAPTRRPPGRKHAPSLSCV